MSTRNPQQRIQAAQVLSQKINLLLDVIRDQSGRTFDFKTIQESADRQGVHLSRTRWHHIKAGDSTVEQPHDVLVALAQFFGVPPDYLTEEDGELPQQVQDELELLRSMRRARVKDFATRSLAGIDRETLQAITTLLDEESPNA